MSGFIQDTNEFRKFMNAETGPNWEYERPEPQDGRWAEYEAWLDEHDATLEEVDENDPIVREMMADSMVDILAGFERD